MSLFDTNIQQIMPQLLHAPVLDIALKQRAKFENWLKVELGAALDKAGFDVRLEKSYTDGGGALYRADVAVVVEGQTHLIMLKTVNTNFRFSGVENAHRPITKNIKGVMEDVHKLAVTLPHTSGYILFPVFPVAAQESGRAGQLAVYLNRIRSCGVEFVAEGFVLRHRDWGISWYSGKVIAHG